MRTTNGKILVLGGGLAGPVAALCLKNAGYEPVIYEPRAPQPGDGGYFLNMGPNGINLLRTLGLGAEIEKYGVPCGDVDFLNGRGRLIGTLNGSDQEERFGAMCQVYKRGELQLALWDAVVSRGVQVEVGKQVSSVTQTESDVAVQFTDGTSAEGSLVLGCDGLHSPTRRSVFPEALEPYYTGLIGCAGYSRSSKITTRPGALELIFAERAFFGYVVSTTGEISWFSNQTIKDIPDRDALRNTPTEVWKERLLELHSGDTPLIAEILNSLVSPIVCTTVYELPTLPSWHRGRVCLLGDAAHATSPHAGQGASMALEDALVVAKCIRDLPDYRQAFAAYDALRRPRVGKLVDEARRAGDQKAQMGPVMCWIRDRLMPIFIRRSRGAYEAVYSHKISWDEPVAA